MQHHRHGTGPLPLNPTYTSHAMAYACMQEGEEYEVVPGSVFTVARTAHRSNQSDYYVNDKKVSAKEVTDRLKGQGIDLDNNRFLILQVCVFMRRKDSSSCRCVCS